MSDFLRDDEVTTEDENPRDIRIRHQQVAQYAAEGMQQKKIAELTGYDDSQVSRILRRPEVRKEIQRYREKFYEDSVAARIKALANPALDVVEDCLLDSAADPEDRRFTSDQQAITARWAVEQANGKAVQKHTHDLGGNALAAMMDRLDAMKLEDRHAPMKDVNPKGLAPGETISEEQELKDWSLSFANRNRLK